MKFFAHICIYTSLTLLSVFDLEAQSSTVADDRLLEAIDHYTGVIGTVNDPRAKELLLEVSQNEDDALAQMWIARVLSTGRMGFQQNLSKAKQMAEGILTEIGALADSGDVEAIFLMGTAHDEGLGTEIDYKQALHWYKAAAKEGHILAIHNVGNMYRDGRGVNVDHSEAATWWLQAAAAGDIIPALRLGEAYEAGRGVHRNIEKAKFWYSKAAEAGNDLADRALKRLLNPKICSSPQKEECYNCRDVQNTDNVNEQKHHITNHLRV
jgi:hypothetical protein